MTDGLSLPPINWHQFISNGRAEKVITPPLNQPLLQMKKSIRKIINKFNILNSLVVHCNSECNFKFNPPDPFMTSLQGHQKVHHPR